MPTNTGKVTKIKSKPRGFVLTVPATIGPPPTPEIDIAYTDVDPDDWAAATAAYTKGSDADVDGTPPTCTCVTAK